MNTITTFAGNLTEDPELRFTNGGIPVANLRVAVNRRVKLNDEWVDGTPTFHSVKVWGTQGENLVESLVRGNRVLVHGQVETESWSDKETGELRYKDVVVVSDRYGEIATSLKFATARPEKSRGSKTTNPDAPAPADNATQLGPRPTEPPF
ncbi:single-stranded DNA-binding protein [Nocardioides sp. NPDC087217]|uniref:single-stranded DNA-binding protein n=1 Tax=Nocardioides sp. NPDC087217 TaxID=3364335 RepID=UPI0037F64638